MHLPTSVVQHVYNIHSFKNSRFKLVTATVQQGIDVVVENVKWLILHEKEIGDWLPKVQTSTVSPTTPSSSNGTYNEFKNMMTLMLSILSAYFIRINQ